MRKWQDTGAFTALNQLSALSGNVARINPTVTVDTKVGLNRNTYLFIGLFAVVLIFIFKKKK